LALLPLGKLCMGFIHYPMKSSVLLELIKFVLVVTCLAVMSGCGPDLRPKLAQLETEVQVLNERAKNLEDRALSAEREKAAIAAELTRERDVSSSERNRLLKELAEETRKLAQIELERDGLRKTIFQFESERREKELALKAERETKASGKIQVGVVMKSGETKPASNITVYLLSSPVESIDVLRRATRKNGVTLAGLWAANSDGMSFSAEIQSEEAYVKEQWREHKERLEQAAGNSTPRLLNLLDQLETVIRSVESKLEARKKLFREAFSTELSRLHPSIEEELNAIASYKATTDFNGVATFPKVDRKEYYIVCRTSLGGGAVFEKRISIKEADFSISLGNSNIKSNYD
jgi:hypothetical protein